jgi:hypothetical protein
MRSVGPRVHAIVVVAVLALSHGKAWAAPRVAFANAAELDRGAKTLIESLRPGLIQDGYETVPPGDLREALEAPLAASEDRLAQARSLLAAAKDAYAGFQFERALEQLARVNPLLAEQHYSDKLAKILAERYVLEGLVYVGAKNPSRAEAAFAMVKRLRPDRKLDPATYHPRIVELFAKAGTGKGAEVPVQIDSTAGARVLVDGAEVGEAPTAISLAAGTHYINLDAPGQVPMGRAVEVTPETAHLSFPLKAAPAEARARRLRDQLMASKSPDELAAAANGICALVEANVVVIIRNREGATFEAAVYRCEPADLSDWVALPSAQFFAALGPAVPGEERRAPDRRLTRTGPVRDSGKKRSWYRTWWGASLLAGAAAAAGTVLYFSLRPEDEYVIDTWCVGGECSQ